MSQSAAVAAPMPQSAAVAAPMRAALKRARATKTAFDYSKD